MYDQQMHNLHKQSMSSYSKLDSNTVGVDGENRKWLMNTFCEALLKQLEHVLVKRNDGNLQH